MQEDAVCTFAMHRGGAQVIYLAFSAAAFRRCSSAHGVYVHQCVFVTCHAFAFPTLQATGYPRQRWAATGLSGPLTGPSSPGGGVIAHKPASVRVQTTSIPFMR